MLQIAHSPQPMSPIGLLADGSHTLGWELGFWPLVSGALAVSLLAMALNALLGAPAAIWLHEYLPDSRMRRLFNFILKHLAGLPAILFGFLGFVWLISPSAGVGRGFAAALMLSLMSLPATVHLTQRLLSEIPNDLRLTAIALGASKMQMIRLVLLPLTLPAIASGVVSAVGRIAGESVALLFFVSFLYENQLSQQEGDRALPVRLINLLANDVERHWPFLLGAAFLMLAFSMALNLSARAVEWYWKKRFQP